MLKDFSFFLPKKYKTLGQSRHFPIFLDRELTLLSSPTMPTWFIDPQRHPGSTIQAYTNDNQVTSLVDEEYMQAAYHLISGAGKGETLCIAGLRMDNVSLLGNSQPDSALLPLLTAAQKRGANVHVLLDGNILYRDANEKTIAQLRESGVNALIDDRRPKFGSQHQKLVCIQKSDSSITALLGSADLCKGRQDNRNHDVKSPDRDKQVHPTHETGVRIEGPATVDLLRGFYDRLGKDDPIPEQQAKGPHQVQVLRTYAQTASGYPWSKQGEFTILDAYLKAIRNAKKMIYLEDQYFWKNENNQPENDIIIELGKAIRRGVKVAVVIPSELETPIPFADFLGPRLRRQAAIGYLEKIAKNARQDGGDFTIATLRRMDAKTGNQQPIYVHSKCLCVDDEFVLTGSANVNNRSMYYDSELNVGIYDPEKTFARKHLRALLAEHLDMEQSFLDRQDIDATYALFKDGNKGSRGRLTEYKTKRNFVPPWLANRVMRIFNPGAPPVNRKRDKENKGTERAYSRSSEKEHAPLSRNPIYIPLPTLAGNSLYKNSHSRKLPPKRSSHPPLLGY